MRWQTEYAELWSAVTVLGSETTLLGCSYWYLLHASRTYIMPKNFFHLKTSFTYLLSLNTTTITKYRFHFKSLPGSCLSDTLLRARGSPHDCDTKAETNVDRTHFCHNLKSSTRLVSLPSPSGSDGYPILDGQRCPCCTWFVFIWSRCWYSLRECKMRIKQFSIVAFFLMKNLHKRAQATTYQIVLNKKTTLKSKG